jgi:hypothetical protein
MIGYVGKVGREFLQIWTSVRILIPVTKLIYNKAQTNVKKVKAIIRASYAACEEENIHFESCEVCGDEINGQILVHSL